MAKKIDSSAPKPMTEAEFDALLEAYEKSNPKKFAVKKANGEFDAFRAKLPKKPAKKAAPKKEAEEAAEELKKKKK